jgi:hypothetical protein
MGALTACEQCAGYVRYNDGMHINSRRLTAFPQSAFAVAPPSELPNDSSDDY